MEISFGMILLACLVPVAIAVFAVQVDEDVAMQCGVHKKHL